MLLYGYVTSESAPPTDYQAVARNLVRDGWTPRDPILLYGGNFFAFRSPLEWYLPDRPDLTLGRPTGRACSRAYVVVVGDARARRLVARLRWRDSHDSTHVTTALLPRPLHPPPPRRHGLHLLTAAAGNSPCLRPLTEARLRAE